MFLFALAKSMSRDGVWVGASTSHAPPCIQVLGDNGAGSYSNVIAGLAWVKQHVEANGNWPAVVSMSLGGSYSPSINEAASELIAVRGKKEGRGFSGKVALASSILFLGGNVLFKHVSLRFLSLTPHPLSSRPASRL